MVGTIYRSEQGEQGSSNNLTVLKFKVILNLETQNIQIPNEEQINPSMFEDSSKELKKNPVATTSAVIKLETLQKTLSYVNKLSKLELFKVLKAYHVREDIFKMLESRLGLKSLYYLCAVVVWMSNKYNSFGKPLIDVTFDPETNDFQFISIILPECDWNSWRRIARDVKTEMEKAQISHFASKVAIVCPEGLHE